MLQKTAKAIILLAIAFAPLFGNGEELSQETKEALQARVKNKVEDFTGYLGDIVNKDLSNQSRLECMNSAKVLFIGNCEPYTVQDAYGNEESHRPVQMEVSSVSRKTKSNIAMGKYLKRQYNNIHGYNRVTIEATDAVRVDNIHKVGNGKYTCMAYWGQKYISYGPDGRVKYGDFTKKGIRVYIDAYTIPGEDNPIFEVKLGDVYALETQRL